MRRWVGFAVLFVLLGGTAAYYATRPARTQTGLEMLLGATGFSHATIGTTRPISGGMEFSMITLGGQNTARAVSWHGNDLRIDHLSLSGAWNGVGYPVITGWKDVPDLMKLVAAMKAGGITTLTLNSAKADITLPVAGTAHLLAKGKLTVLQDGTVRIHGILWGDETPFKGQMNVTGEFAPDGMASLDFDMDDGKTAFGPVSATRMGGWLVLNRMGKASPWDMSAQILAGSAWLYGLPLRGATLSVQGKREHMTISLQAAGMTEKTALAVDASTDSAKGDAMTVTLRTGNFNAFVQSLLTGGVFTEDVAGAGGVVTYNVQAPALAGLLDGGIVRVASLSSETPWLEGRLRRTDDGMAFDIQQSTIKGLAAAFGLIGLEDEGAMTGLLSLRRGEKGRVLIAHGLMRTTSTGVLAYDGPDLPFSASRKDVRALLKSFAYDDMALSLTQEKDAVLAGTIELSGRPLLGQEKAETRLDLKFGKAF